MKRVQCSPLGRRRMLLVVATICLVSSTISFGEALKTPPAASTLSSGPIIRKKRRTTPSTTATATVVQPGGAVAKPKKKASTSSTNASPSFYWAVFHNWMYFLSLGFNAINIPFLIRSIIDGSTDGTPSAQSITLSGQVESVDRFLTFLGIGYLSALSDKYGRKPLMLWSALGFGLTNLIQSSTTHIPSLYLADAIDGVSSCMLPVCQAYTVDCSGANGQQCATNLGIFQGLSAGGAFVFAFPIGGLIGAKKGPKVALRIAAAIQAVNALVLILFTPESHTPDPNQTIDWHKDNPIGGLRRLFGTHSLLRIASTAYFLANLARGSLDAQFPNYTNLRFGWTQAQSGPVLVLVGIMLAIVPRVLVPRLGLRRSIELGLFTFAAGLVGAGLAPTPATFVTSIAVIAVGCVCLPTLQALLANLARPEERGALLGAMGSVNELTGAIASTMYAVILAKFNSDDAPFPMPGFHFVVGAAMLLVAGGMTVHGLKAHKEHKALNSMGGTTSTDLDLF